MGQTHAMKQKPTSTSDDGHLAGDREQSKNVTFEDIPIEAPDGTSDDSHLADHTKQQENAASQEEEERRIAVDGRAYTFHEFLAHYGETKGKSKCNKAENEGNQPSRAPSTQSTASAAVNTLQTDTPPPPPPMVQSAPTPVTVPPPPPLQGGAAPAAVNTLLTPETAAKMRARTNIAGTCKKDMRALLDQISDNQPTNPTQLIHEIPADVSWRHYIARHTEWQRIIGNGIIRAHLEFLPEIRDPNRGGQLRLDFVFENVDGTRCQLHPGGKGKDAKPIFPAV